MTARDIGLPAAAICAAIICYLVYIGKFISFAGTAFGIGWLLFKITLAAALVVSAFFLLHPLTFMLRLRGTPAGQRGHVRFTHLFGLFWLDAGMDRSTREVRLGLWRWSWRIAGHSRERPKRATPPTHPPAAPSPVAEETPHAASPEPPKTPPPSAAAAPAVDAVSAKPAGTTPPPVVETPPKRPRDDAPVSPEAPASPVHPAHAREELPEETPPVTPAVPEEPVRSIPAPASEPEPVVPPFPGAGKRAAEPPRETPFGEKLRADLRRLRRRAAEGWRRVKSWLNLGRRVWRRASPMIRRLAADHWSGFHLLPSVCRVRYGLSEPHLTGLTQGLAAPFAGLLRPFSVRFEPIPVFTGPTVHVSICGSVLVQPWRILKAWLILLTTLDFWKAMRDLWRWNKTRAAPPESPPRP